MKKTGLITVWICTAALTLSWFLIAQLNARLDRAGIEPLATLTNDSDALISADASPQAPDSSPMPEQAVARPRHETLSIHRLRNEVTQLRQQERALRETVEMMRTAQSPHGPLLDESRRLQLEIARLEEIERNLATKAPGDESALPSGQTGP